jgi:ATP-dependent exoDNAse (exonuclease V) beta subunit
MTRPQVDLREPAGFAFDEPTHCYTLHGAPLRSVTALIGAHKRPFDAQAQAERIAKRDGRASQEILREWAEKRDDAAALGSEVHELIDRALRATLGGAPLPTEHPNPWVRGAMRCLAEQQGAGLEIVATEVRLAWPEAQLAGTIDLLAWHRGAWWLIDWKTNERLTLQAEPGWREAKMLDPVAHLDDVHGSHYALQLALYALMLREVYGIEVRHRAIVHLQPDRATVYKLPCLDNEARDLVAVQGES